MRLLIIILISLIALKVLAFEHNSTNKEECYNEIVPVTCENGVTLNADDVAHILKLAKKLDLGPIEKIIAGYYTEILGFLSVRVFAPIKIINEQKVLYRVLYIRREDWEPCFTWDKGTIREGRWVTSETNLHSQEMWRIKDDDWFIDVYLEEGVIYEIAEILVLAFKHEDKSLYGLEHLDSIPRFKASNIYKISVKEKQETGVIYAVDTSHKGLYGETIVVLVTNGKLEVIDAGEWR